MSSARWRASDVAELITRGRYAQRAVDQLLAAPPPRSGRRYVAGSMNGLERRYAEELTLRLAAGDITWWAFEAVKLRLAPRTFLTVDFAVLPKFSHRLELHEVKGHWEDDARVKIKVDAAAYPCFAFRAVTWRRDVGAWQLEDFPR